MGTKKIVRQMLENDLKNVEGRSPIYPRAFGYERSTTKEQKSILSHSAVILEDVHRRDVERCEQRLEAFEEVGKLPPAPEGRYVFFKEGNEPTAEVSRKRRG